MTDRRDQLVVNIQYYASRKHSRRIPIMRGDLRVKKLLASIVFGSISMLLVDQALAENTEAFAILASTPYAHMNYGSNVVKGRAELHSASHSSTTVVVRLVGLKPGSIHVSHIHHGTCVQLSPGEISNDLSPMVANERGVGVSKTEIPGKLADLADCTWWVAVHEGPVNATPQTPAIAVGPVITRSETQNETRGSKN